MSEKKLATIFYADLWGLRNEKYDYLLRNDIKTTKWEELRPVEPYYFFVPKDFALQEEYGKFWKITDIFKEWSSGVKTHRDHFVVGFTKEEIIQRLRVFAGNLADDFVEEALKLKDTGTWKLSEARKKIKDKRPEVKIYPYAYRPFDIRWICYESSLIDRDRWPFMRYLLKVNLSLVATRILSKPPFTHILISNCISDICLISIKTKETAYFYPLYLYLDDPERRIFDEKTSGQERIPNFSNDFLQATKKSLNVEPTPEQIFYYIYAVLYCPQYRKHYEEFLRIDFPRIPLPKDYKSFKALSNLGQELVDLHLLKHPSLSETYIGFPESGSNIVEKVSHDEKNQKVFINKIQYFEGVSNKVWKYRIGAYQVMEKYLKDRKGRTLSLDEINHYLKVEKAIRLTIEIQRNINKIYAKI
ncbi:MAG: type ISP restriction/modification enzyme [Acidobacteriota bacterium]|nr:type ISP restriction/modification enzyme [Acidobacteriota bacterium]